MTKLKLTKQNMNIQERGSSKWNSSVKSVNSTKQNLIDTI